MEELQVVSLENTEITSWDFQMIKTELQHHLAAYSNLVYSDNTIKEAKNDRATLNKVKKAISDAEKTYKAKCLEPYEALKPQIRELIDLVEEQRTLIDSTVKDFETRQREAKEQEVRKYYDRKAVVLGSMADRLYSKLFDKKWVNATTARTKYEEEIVAAINKAAMDIEKIRGINSPFVDTLLEVYADTYSMDQVNEKQTELESAAKRASLTTVEKAAAAIGSASPAVNPTEQVPVNADAGVTMKIFATQNQMNQITDFMKAIGVRYECI